MFRALKRSLERLEPPKFFLFAAVFFQIFYFAFSPPFQSPDEYNHFYRIVQIAEGNVKATKMNQRLGGEVPACEREFMVRCWRFSICDRIKNWSDEMPADTIHCDCDTTMFRDFPNTAIYSPVSYIPQAVAVFVLRKLGTSAPVWYYGACVTIFLFWLFAMHLVLRILPVGRWLFTALMLTPTHLHQAGTLSADTVTNILSFLLLAFVLRACATKRVFSARDLVVLSLLILCLVFAKLVYAGLICVLIILPKANFGSGFRKYAFISGIAALTLTLSLWWSSYSMEQYIPYSQYNPEFRNHSALHPEADHIRQREGLRNDPSSLLRVIWNSACTLENYDLRNYFGSFGHYLGISLPMDMPVIALGLLILIALFEGNAWSPSLGQKAIFPAIFFGMFALIVVSQHLIWNAVGRDVFDRLQGRYLIPAAPLIFLLLSNTRPWPRFLSVLGTIGLVVMLNTAALMALNHRFSDAGCKRVLYRQEDFERRENLPQANVSSEQARSGKYSARLEPGDTLTLQVIPYIQQGDLVEISWWRKGSGGLLLIEALHCNEAYPNNEVHYVSKSGWERMNISWELHPQCEDPPFRIALVNTGPAEAYADDIRIDIHRCK